MKKRNFLRGSLPIILAGASVFTSGCEYPSYFNMPKGTTFSEYKEVRADYNSIDLDNLTIEQREALREFNQYEFSKEELEGIRYDFPWINPKKMSDKDKIFAYQKFEEFAKALMIGSY